MMPIMSGQCRPNAILEREWLALRWATGVRPTSNQRLAIRRFRDRHSSVMEEILVLTHRQLTPRIGNMMFILAFNFLHVSNI